MKKDVITFGAAVRERRHKLAWSVRHLASLIRREGSEKCGISPQYLNDIELNRRFPTSDHMIQQFSEVLGLDSDWLYYLANRFPEDLRERQFSQYEFKARMTAFRRTAYN